MSNTGLITINQNQNSSRSLFGTVEFCPSSSACSVRQNARSEPQ